VLQFKEVAVQAKEAVPLHKEAALLKAQLPEGVQEGNSSKYR
jgi:hypothetical protein